MPLGCSRLTDMTIGFGSHGLPCCPHIIIGYRITGSYNTNTNKLSSSRSTLDIGFHDCPHCPINMCITGSPNVYINNLQEHRLTDVVTEFCGTGFTVTASLNCFD